VWGLGRMDGPMAARRHRPAEHRLLAVSMAMINYRPLVSELAIDRRLDVYDLLELFDERAALREYEGEQRRDVAERGAYNDVVAHVKRR